MKNAHYRQWNAHLWTIKASNDRQWSLIQVKIVKSQYCLVLSFESVRSSPASCPHPRPTSFSPASHPPPALILLGSLPPVPPLCKHWCLQGFFLYIFCFKLFHFQFKWIIWIVPKTNRPNIDNSLQMSTDYSIYYQNALPSLVWIGFWSSNFKWDQILILNTHQLLDCKHPIWSDAQASTFIWNYYLLLHSSFVCCIFSLTLLIRSFYMTTGQWWKAFMRVQEKTQ